MSSAAMPGSFASPIGRTRREAAVLAALRAMPKWMQVVPVERRQQEGRRHAALGEEAVRGRPCRRSAAPCTCPCSVGMRSSSSGTQRRVSSSVDQTTCCTPAAFAAACAIVARLRPSRSRARSGPRRRSRSRRRRRRRTPPRGSPGRRCPPARPRRRRRQRPRRRRAGSRVSARAAKPPCGSARIARTRPPPWAPVAPATAMILSASIILLIASGGPSSSRGDCRRSSVARGLWERGQGV